MRAFADLPIQRKLTLLSVATSGFTLLLASALLVTYERIAFREEMVADLAATAQTLGFNSASALAFDDADSAAQILRSLETRPQIIAACIYNQQGAVFATYPDNRAAAMLGPAPPRADHQFGADSLDLSRPIFSVRDRVGMIALRSDLRVLRERTRRHLLIVGAVLVGATLVAYLIASRLQRLISGRIAGLAQVASRVASERNYALRVPTGGNDELGQLNACFNDMLTQIQARDSALQAAHDQLEQRVAERTAELERENAERKRAELALQSSETFLQSLVQTLPVHIFRKDREGRFTFVNQRFSERRGLPPDRILGRTAFDLLSRAEAEEQTRIDRHILATGEVHHATERHARPDGSPSFVDLIKVPVLDAGGRPVGIQGMFLDVTERKLAEDRLAEASGLLDAMLANSPDLIFFKDRDSRYVRFGAAVLRRFGLDDPARLHGRTDADFFAPDHAAQTLAEEGNIIATGEAVVGKPEKEVYLDGRIRWALTTKLPWRDGTGAIVGTFAISKDITELKEAEDRLAYERDQLRSLLDSSPDTIYFKDLQSRFVLVSRSKVEHALARLPDLRQRRAAKGLPADVPERELLAGLTDFDTYQGEDAQRAFDDEQQIIRTGQPVVGKLEKQLFLDGTVCWNLTSKMPWRDREGNIIGTFGISKDVTDVKQTEERLEQLNRQLRDTSRQAGMAEVATGVLHNVGNVLNSVNVSATLVADHVRHSKSGNVGKLSALFEQHKANLAEFLTHDPRGRMVPSYLGTLAESLANEHKAILGELDQLRKNVEHIKEIVAMQQAYARTSGITETVSVPDMIEDALRMNAGSLARHDVDTVRDYQARPVVTTDKHKVMQILINLVRNAKYACDEAGRPDKRIVVRTTADERHVRIAVIDNGVGISAENLTRIFAHGFTTRQHGHGFGLHSGALAAKELGGSLTVHSDGPGKGAVFTLELPFKPHSASS